MRNDDDERNCDLSNDEENNHSRSFPRDLSTAIEVIQKITYNRAVPERIIPVPFNLESDYNKFSLSPKNFQKRKREKEETQKARIILQKAAASYYI